MTPAQLRAKADSAEASAKEAERGGIEAKAVFDREAAAFRDLAARLRALADEMESTRLTSEHIPSTVDDVSTTLSSNALRSQSQIADAAKKHRLVVAMKARSLSFADVAEALEAKLKPRSFPRSTVQSWVKPKSDASYRAIPQDAADALKALYGVPLSAWPRIIPGT